MKRLDFISWLEKKKDESYSGSPSFGMTGTHDGIGGKYMKSAKKKKRKK